MKAQSAQKKAYDCMTEELIDEWENVSWFSCHLSPKGNTGNCVDPFMVHMYRAVSYAINVEVCLVVWMMLGAKYYYRDCSLEEMLT